MANALVRKSDPSKFITTTMQLQQNAMDTKARTATNILKQPSTNTYPTNSNTNTQSSPYSTYNDDDDHDHKSESAIKVVDFHRYIHKDTYNPKLIAMISKRKHPLQNRDADECRGPKWETVATTSKTSKAIE